MANDPVKMSVVVSEDTPNALTFSILHDDGRPIGHINLDPPAIEWLLNQLVQGRQLLRSGKAEIDVQDVEAGDALPIPAPILRPAWVVGDGEDGDPLIAHQVSPGVWMSFSLSPEDAMQMATMLLQSGPHAQKH